MPLFSFGVFKCKIIEINWFAHICTLSHRQCHSVTLATVKKLCTFKQFSACDFTFSHKKIGCYRVTCNKNWSVRHDKTNFIH